ncbi:MAG: hypothetical protein IT405_00370 [Candidatus Yanofskybacteria bacterium]|nr:hypothetical protein [Candidatus Yanofskybacteria bacterium]
MNNEADRDGRIGELLEYDAIAVGEDMAEFAGLGPDVGVPLGFMLFQDANARKEQALTEADDTVLLGDLERYLRIVAAEGFTEVLRVPFTVEDNYGSSGGEVKREALFVFFHDRDGILLVFDTYGGGKVNSGHFYYNWVPKRSQQLGMPTGASGGWYGERLWVGHHDCREALRFKLRRLRQRGSFVPTWQRQPFLWLLHYGDHPTGRSTTTTPSCRSGCSSCRSTCSGASRATSRPARATASRRSSSSPTQKSFMLSAVWGFSVAKHLLRMKEV